MVGESVAMRALRKQIAIVAPTDGRILISGESGTGKELVARAIHAQSKRKNAPFVEINSAAIPEDLVEILAAPHYSIPSGLFTIDLFEQRACKFVLFARF